MRKYPGAPFFGASIVGMFILTTGALMAGQPSQGFVNPAAERNADLTVLSRDRRTLNVDATGNQHVWNWFWRSGKLKPQTDYSATFRYRALPGNQDGGFLHILCRPLEYVARTAASADTLRRDFYPESEERTVTLHFRTGSQADYAFQIHGGNRVKAEISGFRLDEDKARTAFFPAVRDAVPFAENFGDLPTGAEEFDVDIPDNPEGAVVHAADFGFSELADDNTDALNRAIAHCREMNAARLTLAPGNFSMTADHPVLLENMRDFELDGRGATLVYRKKHGSNFRIFACERVVIRNLSVDWDWKNDPLASVVRVERKENDVIDLRFVEYDRFPRRDVQIQEASSYDPETGSVGLEFGQDIGFGDGRLHRWISDNVLRVVADSPVEEGEFYRVKHYFYAMDGFDMEDNRHLTFEDVNVYSTAGHAFCVRGRQQYWRMNRVRIAPPAGMPRRPISCTADSVHFYRSRGFFKLENSEFAFGGDDCVNVHDTVGFGEKIDERTIRVRTRKAPEAGAPLELRHGDYSPALAEATAVSVHPVENAGGFFDVTLDRAVPEPLEGERGFVLFDHTYGTRNIIIRNNYFHDNRARGLLILARDVTVENNRFFHNQMAAIKIETGYTFHSWSEGYGASNIVIRGNRFDTTNPQGTTSDGMGRDIYIGVYLETDPSTRRTNYPILSGILFEGNMFKDSFGLAAFITSADNVTFRDNTFFNPTPRKAEPPYRGGFHVANANNVRIINNRYISSPYVSKPGVQVDSKTTGNIIAEGNVLVDVR